MHACYICGVVSREKKYFFKSPIWPSEKVWIFRQNLLGICGALYGLFQKSLEVILGLDGMTSTLPCIKL